MKRELLLHLARDYAIGAKVRLKTKLGDPNVNEIDRGEVLGYEPAPSRNAAEMVRVKIYAKSGTYYTIVAPSMIEPEDDEVAPELDQKFFADAILCGPNENLIEKLSYERGLDTE